MVYDGGGIDPDIKLVEQDPSTITQVLYSNGFIFDYGTVYASKHASLADAKSFSLTDAEYAEFVAWMKTKDYNYRSPIEIRLSQLTQEAKSERFLR